MKGSDVPELSEQGRPLMMMSSLPVSRCRTAHHQYGLRLNVRVHGSQMARLRDPLSNHSLTALTREKQILGEEKCHEILALTHLNSGLWYAVRGEKDPVRT